MKNLLLLNALVLTIASFAQTTMPNGDLENWQNVGANTEEPTNWNSNKTGGGFASIGPQTCYRESVNPHGGSYCARVETKNYFGTPVNGSITTGKIQAPSTDPNQGYIQTLTTDANFNAPFTGRPDSIVGWYKYTVAGSDKGKVKILLHTANNISEPDLQGTNGTSVIGQAEFLTPSANVSAWTRFSVPFTYNNTNTPAYLLAIVTASESPASATNGSKMWIDDLEFKYCVPPTADAPANVVACDAYTLPALTVGNYFTGAGGTGTALSASDVITTDQTIYVYAVNGNCSDENSFTIDITATPTADAPANVTACNAYALPALAGGNYFTGAGGTGTALSASDVISSDQTIYVYATNGSCSDENSFTIEITAGPVADVPANVTACDSYTLPALTVGNYFTGAGGTGTALSASDVISTDQTIYVYVSNGTCSDENSFDVTINTVDNTVTVVDAVTLQSNTSTATSYKWVDCNNGNSEIPGATSQTFVASSNGSYAVEVTENGCTATSACNIISQVSLNEVSAANVQLYPNPTSTNIQLVFDNANVDQLTIMDTKGREIYSISTPESGVIIDLNNLEAGIYLFQLNIGNQLITKRVIKE